MGHELEAELNAGNLSSWLNYLAELANRYKNNPGMCGIYILNEWQFILDSNKCHTYAVEAARTLNAINPNLLVLVHGDLVNRAGFDTYWLANPIPYPNIVYLYHDYFFQYYYYSSASGHQWTSPPADFISSYMAGNFALAKQQMEANFYGKLWKYTTTNNICLALEEFGFTLGQKPELVAGDIGYEPGAPQCMKDYLELLNKYKISWNEYAWQQGGYALANEDGSLNAAGQIWKDYLLGT
jgi:hypothetical protein